MLDVDSICKEFPDLAHHIKYYDYMVTRFKFDCNAIVDVARKIYKDSDDRKAVALSIKDHPYKSIGFKCLDNDFTLDELLENFNKDKYAYITKCIGTYQPTPINAFEIYNEYKRKES